MQTWKPSLETWKPPCPTLEWGVVVRVLVVGSGGREHALVRKLSDDARRRGRELALHAAPGNPGIARIAECADVAADDVDGLLALARRVQADLTVVGPEVPLALGIADAFAAAGLRVFGPGAAAARLESSKSFAKDVMREAGVPTAQSEAFSSLEDALAHVRTIRPPVVIKADGLAAGKGVTVALTLAEAEQALREAMEGRAFGTAGETVVVEQFLVGTELSVMAFVDGSGYRLMPAARDHKAVYDGDRGANTGGMGVFAPPRAATAELMGLVRERVFDRMQAYFRAHDTVYRGVLYAGLMIVDGAPFVIEFNCRFGDPEAQVVLELLDSDLLDAMLAVADDRIASHGLVWSDAAAVCVVLAAEGYPEAYGRGERIEGLEAVEDFARAQEAAGAGAVRVLHAGTAEPSAGVIVTNGGRVLGVVARADDLDRARRLAYDGVERVRFAGRHYRTDIGARG